MTTSKDHGLIGRAGCRHLARLARQVPADQAIVEIGVFRAGTTIWLAHGAQAGAGAHVWGVDPWDLPGERYPFKWLNDPVKGKTRRLFTRTETRLEAERRTAQYENITLIRGFSVDVAETWAGPKIGLLFVDGDHREEFVRADWDAWSPHLMPDATVLWDDYQPDYPGVTTVVDNLIAQKQLRKVGLLAGRLAVTAPQ